MQNLVKESDKQKKELNQNIVEMKEYQEKLKHEAVKLKENYQNVFEKYTKLKLESQKSKPSLLHIDDQADQRATFGLSERSDILSATNKEDKPQENKDAANMYVKDLIQTEEQKYYESMPGNIEMRNAYTDIGELQADIQAHYEDMQLNIVEVNMFGEFKEMLMDKENRSAMLSTTYNKKVEKALNWEQGCLNVVDDEYISVKVDPKASRNFDLSIKLTNHKGEQTEIGQAQFPFDLEKLKQTD